MQQTENQPIQTRLPEGVRALPTQTELEQILRSASQQRAEYIATRVGVVFRAAGRTTARLLRLESFPRAARIGAMQG